MKHIEFETAKILNKKGFTESNGNAYLLTEFKNCVTNPENVVNSPIGTMIGYSIKDKTIPAPYQEEVIEWLLNEHKIFIQIEIEQADGRFSYLIFTRTGLSVLYGCAIIGGKHLYRNRAIEMAILDSLKLIN